MNTPGRKELASKSAKGFAISFVAQGLKAVIQFAYQILLARMLFPQDFGLVAMTAPIVTFLQVFCDLGLFHATIQRKDITQAELSFLFWINLGISVSLAALMVALSPVAGWFYHEPKVTIIAAISSVFLVFSGLAGQHMALLNRHMRFGAIALVDIISYSLGVIAGLVAASRGLGYWSLVIAQGTIQLTTVILAWNLTKWRPSLPEKIEHWREFLHFGGNLAGFNILNFFSRNLDNVLIGRYHGENALGLYDRAYKLLLFPLQQISAPFSRVAIPLLSRLSDEPEAYRKAYTKMLEAVMLLTYPGVILAIAASEPLITTLLGEQWKEVAAIFTVLGVGALFAPIGNSTGWLFISQARTKEMRNWGIISAVLYIASFIIGLRWGAYGVAVCYTISGALQAPLLWWLMTRSGHVRLSDLMKIIIPYSAASVVCYGAIRAYLHYDTPNLIMLIVLGISIYILFTALLMLFPWSRETLLDGFIKLRNKIKKNRVHPSDSSPA